jgi:hypothetical protein
LEENVMSNETEECIFYILDMLSVHTRLGYTAKDIQERLHQHSLELTLEQIDELLDTMQGDLIDLGVDGRYYISHEGEKQYERYTYR